MNDYTYIFKTCKCAECGKEFIPAPMHIFKRYSKWFCCYTCEKHYLDRKEAAKRKKVRCKTVLYEEENRKMEIKVMLECGAYVPSRAHGGDAGLDIKTPKEFTLSAHSSHVVKTGVHMEIPYGAVGFIKSKSGLNVRHGITSEGVIDYGYTGEIAVKLYNNSDKDYYFSVGDKISQIVILPVILAETVQTDALAKTERGDGGFGSTGR